MRMSQSLHELERAFEQEIALERTRAAALRTTARKRTRVRHVKRQRKRGTMRYVLLVLSLIGTAVLVTVVMFRVLYLLLG